MPTFFFIGCAGGGPNLGGLIAPFMGEKLAGKSNVRFMKVEGILPAELVVSE